MAYDYQTQRPWLFTDEGQRYFLKVRDSAHRLLRMAGAFRAQEALASIGGSGSSWHQLAALDRLVELGEIKCISQDTWAQHQIFVSTVRED